MKALLTGGRGMLASSIRDAWASRRADDELIVVDRADADLRDPAAVRALLEGHRPDVVLHAAAKVGGIGDKVAHPLGYLRDNLAIDAAVIGGSIDAGVGELLYVGSAVVYPQHTPQPIAEAALLTGPLEAANEPYAIAKIAGVKLCEYASRELGLAYRVILPSNLYGPHDRFDPATAHLIAAAVTKVVTAQREGAPSVEVWGDGHARREFTFAGDLAAWLVGQVGSLGGWPDRLNVGAGTDHSIAEYYQLVAELAGYDGALVFDPTRPAGVAQRLLDSSRARELGWAPPTSLRDGLALVIDRYREFEKGSAA